MHKPLGHGTSGEGLFFCLFVCLFCLFWVVVVVCLFVCFFVVVVVLLFFFISFEGLDTESVTESP